MRLSASIIHLFDFSKFFGEKNRRFPQKNVPAVPQEDRWIYENIRQFSLYSVCRTKYFVYLCRAIE
ncbi:hypothetical protein HMPREF9012_1981 [Bacteroidetes bacterium oral taxon 272 str. F0290]|nr:hypothetical protein HMPREF9012_1981 [Bacteroidetes bacterium oral taxon 272 str. F0290]